MDIETPSLAVQKSALLRMLAPSCTSPQNVAVVVTAADEKKKTIIPAHPNYNYINTANDNYANNSNIINYNINSSALIVSGQMNKQLALTTTTTQVGLKRDRNLHFLEESLGMSDIPIVSVPSETLRETAQNRRQLPTECLRSFSEHRDWKLQSKLISHQGTVTSIAVDPHNSWFVTGGADTVLKIWDMNTRKLRRNLTGHVEAVRGVALSCTAPYLFSCGDDHAVKCFDLETSACIRDYHGHKGAVNAISCHPLLDYVVTTGRDKTVRVWDVRQQRCVRVMYGHTDTGLCVATQATEPQVITGGADACVFLWDIGVGKPLAKLCGHGKAVRAVAAHPVEESFVSVAADGLRKWRLPSGERHVRNFTNATIQATEDEGVWRCAALGKRNELVVGGDDGELRFYDWANACLVQRKVSKGTEEGFQCVAFDGSATALITGGRSKVVKVWAQKQMGTRIVL